MSIATKLQPPGEVLDMKKSNTEEVHITVDAGSRLCNNVIVLGDFFQLEATFPLQPAWNPTYDNMNSGLVKRCRRDSADWKTFPDLARAWRDWVLNEAGDYNGKRATITEPFDFNVHTPAPGYTIQTCFRRRKFEPCITLGDDLHPIGQHGGIVVEWWDSRAVDNSNPQRPVTGLWKPVDSTGMDCSSIKILDKECGIRFDGLEPPSELFRQGIGTAKVRVTASVQMDYRIIWEEKAKASVNTNTVTQLLDMPSRFKWRKVAIGSLHYAKVLSGTLKSTQADDRLDANKLALELLDNWNQASVNGTVVIAGTDWAIGNPLGKAFAGIAGRGIDFRTNVGNTAKYPQVTGYKIDVPGQKIHLSLDTWRQEAL